MKHSLLLTLTLSLLLSAAAAHAQVDLKATIPFDFQVGSKVLPAGSYKITSDTVSGIVQVRGNAEALGENAVMVSFAVGGGNIRAGHSKLVFQKYANRYFLSEMWRGDSSHGRKLPESRSERLMARLETATPVTVLLAQKR